MYGWSRAEFEKTHMILGVDWAKTDSQGELVGQRAAVNKGKPADSTESVATLRLPSTEHAISHSWPLTWAAKQRIRFCIQCPGIQTENPYKPRVWAPSRRKQILDLKRMSEALIRRDNRIHLNGAAEWKDQKAKTSKTLPVRVGGIWQEYQDRYGVRSIYFGQYYAPWQTQDNYWEKLGKRYWRIWKLFLRNRMPKPANLWASGRWPS